MELLFSIIHYILFLVPLLLAIAFFTVFERQILSSLQRRQGPNTVGFYGIFQAIADGVKLILKEIILPKSSNSLMFILAPVFTFALALTNWAVIPFGNGWAFSNYNLGLLYIFAISSFSVHSIVLAGWSSNSKYAFLGSLRSAAQMISYEVAMGITALNVALLAGSLNLNSIILAQSKLWFCFLMFPMFLVFFICILAETNRHPFDLPEAEAELVSGYNVEYSGFSFALFFLAEYSNIILMSTLITILFCGGWYPLFSFDRIFIYIPNIFWFSLKILFFIFLFILVRGILPRFRYDQLMRLGWKIFMPFSLAYLIILASVLLSFDWLYLR